MQPRSRQHDRAACEHHAELRLGILPNLDALRAQREKAYRGFVADYRQHGHARYIETEFPNSRFADGQFDLALVSHFLFLDDEQLDYDFHKHTLLELLRIAREVRLFPLVNMRTERASAIAKLPPGAMIVIGWSRCTSRIS